MKKEDKKQRNFLIVAALTAVMALSGCGDGGNSVRESDVGESGLTEKINLKISVGESEEYYMSQFMTKWLESIEEKSGGMITGKIYFNGQIGGGTEMFEILDMNNAQVYMDGDATAGAVNKAFNVFGLPYLFDSKEHRYNFWDTYFTETSDWLAEQSGIRVVGIIDGLNRETTLRYPVETLKDLQNVKIRVPAIESYIKIWETLGAAPIPISYFETYTSIQTGVVDGQENDIALSRDGGFTEVAPYVIMTDHVHYEGAIYFDEGYWQSLSQEARDIILEAAQEVMMESRSYCETLEKDTITQLEEEGVTFIYPDLTEFKEKTKTLRDECTEGAYVLELIDAARR